MPGLLHGGEPTHSGADLAILAELLAEMSAAGSVEQIAASLTRSAKWVVPNERCTLLLRHDDGQSWHLYPGGSSGRVEALPAPLQHALERGQNVVEVDGADHNADDPIVSQILGPDCRSVMILPLKTANTTFGTLNLSSARPDAYPRRPSATVELLRMNVAAVVQSALRLDQAEKLSELRSRLVATVSHDYKSPLAAILGFSELLLAREFDRERRREMLELIQSETLRLNTMVGEVLDLSRLTLQGVEQRREPLDLPAMIDYCLGTYRAGGLAVPIHTFKVQVAPVLPRTAGDPARVTQVLMNLIGNAVKYSPNGGEITMSVRPDPDRREILVAVADHGMGMNPHDIERLFQPFQRTREAIMSGIEGTGLGLAICHEIAQAHGGRLWAESRGIGQGSTFVLALPAEALVPAPPFRAA